MIRVVPFTYNVLDDLCANTYLCIDSGFNCVIIDPSCDYDGVINYIERESLNPKAILLTHGHFDHIKGVDRIYKRYQLPIYISFEDEPLLKDPELNFSSENSKKVIITSPITTIRDDILEKILEETIRIIETPYHTRGGVCYYLKDSKILFSGDSLFKKMIGRNDLATSIPSKRKESLAKLMALPDDVKVYPGHGGFTSIKEEKKSNPFIAR